MRFWVASEENLNFNKIEIRGFKSFADKVTIDFHDGVTAIIGPNGCGKSNIADAIRWTLGEQSAKSLRGKNMQDVIFNGTENRRSTSYCEVSLFFDNTDHKVFPAIDFDEVVITRKLDRSGNSEYQINNNRCRMKDVINLIHDTGIGKEGYSIIGQGRVDEILSSKPDDRRHIFEEAAGISKFRAQRTEAERKLGRALQNLNIANEKISEVERQLVPLRKQAENTQKFFEYREQLKIKELNQYIYQYDNNEAVKEKIRQKLKASDEEIKEVEKNLQKSLADYDFCMQQIGSMDKMFRDYNEELLMLSVDQERASGEGKVLQEKLANLTSDEHRISEELKSLELQLVYCDEQIKKAKERKEQKLEEFLDASKQQKETEEKFNTLSSNLSNAESLKELKNMEYIEAVEELSKLKTNMSSYMAEKGVQQERANNLQNLLSQKKKQLDAEVTALTIAETNLSKSKETSRSLMTEYNEKLSSTMEAKQAIEGYNEDIMSFNTKLGVMEGNLQSLIAIKEDYAGYQGAIKSLMNDSKSNPNLNDRVLGVVAGIMKVPEEYVSAVENSLGASLQNVVCETEDDASYLIDYLKQKRYGRVTFRPLSACRPKSLNEKNRSALHENGCIGLICDLIDYDPKFDVLMKALLGDTVVVDNKTTAIRLFRNYNHSFRIVTLDGDLFAVNGSITGGSRRVEKSGLLEQEEQIANARKGLDKLKLNISRMNEMRAEKQKEISDNDARLSGIQEDLAETKVECGLFEERLKLSNSNIEELKVEIAESAKNLEEIKQSISDLMQKIGSIDDLEKIVSEKKNQIGAQTEDTKTDESDKKNEKDVLFERMMELRVKVATLKAEADSIDDELFRYQREENSLKESILDTKAQESTVKNKIENLSSSSQKSHFSEKELERIAFLKKEKDNVTAMKTKLQNSLTEHDNKREEFTKKKTDISERKVRDEGLLERVDIEIRSMQEHILDEYKLTYASALEFKEDDFDAKNCANEITSIKRQIGRLGDVNFLAVEDLKELENRYKTMTVERDDIQNGHDDLKKIIAELTDEMVIKFQDAFDQINSNFQRVFKTLFDGGNGKLILENIEDKDKDKMIDPLKAGIEIFAQPPGKKLQHISLLSGGEKALTAIAILFAILELKPMPFCVLDEIEAALDDANANLFSEYLRKFSDNTQFIVITHRKPTMRNADSIYGVTMQEKGVTKTVKVEFEEAVKHIKDAG